ncbi:hypothetical protein KM176_16665 [Pseudooceanicola sp. CBS1P-1]|uniref:Uncharacterized protein n=1 Tax=Pseudooceanicola albus TaxID=2692189 RepID=A0A6L7G5C4_9RHOB|nr:MULTISPECIES: hypothetical protein [Pseudooceanicola]MBT9385509.1 hypothetical protein [Pseudooceanicola endophyticus]MXN19079.1 hypothetical protein [Pseudooceanicola albus]
MMTSLHPEDAAKQWRCPLAKTFGAAKVTGFCAGDACAVWRWMPMSANDPRFVSAVQREIASLQEANPKATKVALHKQAVARVMADPNAFTFPNETDRGYCGLGGPIEAMKK